MLPCAGEVHLLELERDGGGGQRWLPRLVVSGVDAAVEDAGWAAIEYQRFGSALAFSGEPRAALPPSQPAIATPSPPPPPSPPTPSPLPPGAEDFGTPLLFVGAEGDTTSAQASWVQPNPMPEPEPNSTQAPNADAKSELKSDAEISKQRRVTLARTLAPKPSPSP